MLRRSPVAAITLTLLAAAALACTSSNGEGTSDAPIPTVITPTPLSEADVPDITGLWAGTITLQPQGDVLPFCIELVAGDGVESAIYFNRERQQNLYGSVDAAGLVLATSDDQAEVLEARFSDGSATGAWGMPGAAGGLTGELALDWQEGESCQAIEPGAE